METIDRNAIEELAGTLQMAGIALQKLCGPAAGFEIPKCAMPALTMCMCLGSENLGPCKLLKVLPQLTEYLVVCGGEFYIRCPGFDDLAKDCDLKPAIEAAKWKEKVQLDRIAQLEARVQELEVKRKG